jgi:tetratricopeptide (TPR) repeat protein
VRAAESVAVLALTAFASPARAALLRDGADESDLAAMATEHPAAAEDIVAGEALANAGNVTGAIDRFMRADAQAPGTVLAPRRLCEALAAVGRAEEAVRACGRALAASGWPAPNRGSPVVMRAMAGAWVSGRRPPTPEALTQALALAKEARHKSPDQPWGYAASCDIAQRIGDDVMLQDCLTELERVAPNHPETARARAAAAARRPTWRVGAAWIALFLVALGTVARELGSAVVARRQRRDRAFAIAGLLLLGLSALARPALAKPAESHPDRVSDWVIDDANPESSIPPVEAQKKNPLEMGYWVMDLIAKAQEAAKREDHAAAVKYFRALAKAAPDKSIAFMKLCAEYDAMNDWGNAAKSCARGVRLSGVTAEDRAQFIRVMVGKATPWTPDEAKMVDTVYQNLKDDPRATDLEVTECGMALKTGNDARLDECTPKLVARWPDSTMTLMAQWTLATHRHDRAAMARIIDHAKALKLPPEVIGRLETELNGPTKIGLFVLFIALVAIAIGALVVFWRERTKLPTDADRKAPPGPPTPPAAPGPEGEPPSGVPQDARVDAEVA